MRTLSEMARELDLNKTARQIEVEKGIAQAAINFKNTIENLEEIINYATFHLNYLKELQGKIYQGEISYQELQEHINRAMQSIKEKF